MTLTFSTPGVSVEERSMLPPSVAQVATAIPAFIGYTDKAIAPDGSSLKLVPTRITSMLDYETMFGGADPQKDITVSVTGDVVKAELDVNDRSQFMIYYSMQMYFANGGGPCYIVSVGKYSDAFNLSTLKAGLTELEKEDEPTLILFPDATSLSADDAYGLYNDALTQCNKLQDRFAIIDGLMSNPGNPSSIDVENDFETLRTKIYDDISLRKYGAAYYPYLKSILDYVYKDADVNVSITTTGDFGAQVTALSTGSVTSIRGAFTTYLNELTLLDSNANNAANDTAALALVPNFRNKINQIVASSNALIATLTSMVDIGRSVIANNPTHAGTADLLAATNALDSWITTHLEQLNLSMSESLDDLNAVTTKAQLITASADLMSAFGDPAADINTLQSTEITTLVSKLGPFSSATTNTTLDTLLTSNNVLYNRIKTAIGQIPVLLPPGATMAGIYARTDAESGVWKAPANTSLNYVSGLNYAISNDTQGGMNVHETGKSINAIRSFTGRGILAWGARTLAGGDNEWKYISVRRFYNMVEESVKNATEGFVFQSNDANTWVKVRAMIENFLVLQWKAGALAGAKPEQAFYVRVGLGSTMTANDVLEGRMIVEIGMAVVRPAEFIVLRFSHMMQQA